MFKCTERGLEEVGKPRKELSQEDLDFIKEMFEDCSGCSDYSCHPTIGTPEELFPEEPLTP